MFDRPPRNQFRTPDITERHITATVKWFNPDKGFGFVTPENGSPDAFLHASVLHTAGHDALPDGATIVCDLSRGPKGPQVATVHSVDLSTAAPTRRGPGAPMGGGGGGGGRRENGGGGFGGPSRGGYGGGGGGGGGGETLQGTVKWFNSTKGFGFVAPDEGGKDIFVHVSALGRSGLSTLADGQRVKVTIRQGPKGPEAEVLEVA